MRFNAQAALAEIDAVLADYEQVKTKYTTTYFSDYDRKQVSYIDCPPDVLSHILLLMKGAIRRLATDRELLRDAEQRAAETSGDDHSLKTFAGALTAMRSDFATGRFRTLQERVHSDTFSDFLETAEYLLQDEGLKDPAAVMIGGVLEQHLRELCDKNAILATTPDGKPKKLDAMNAELAKANVYGKNEQKQITAWTGIRNDAAHANYDKYKKEDVDLMARWVRNFVGNYPA